MRDPDWRGRECEMCAQVYLLRTGRDGQRHPRTEHLLSARLRAVLCRYHSIKVQSYYPNVTVEETEAHRNNPS